MWNKKSDVEHDSSLFGVQIFRPVALAGIASAIVPALASPEPTPTASAEPSPIISTVTGLDPVLEGGVQRVASVKDIAQAFKQTGDRFFIQGSMSISQEGIDNVLRTLERHPNWAVAFLKDVGSEQYSTPSETSHGVSAAYNYLGIEFINGTKFGQSIDPRSGERNSAMYVIIIDQEDRNLKLSAAHELYGLSENSEQLYAPGDAALNDGMDLARAAISTIEGAENELSERIESAERRPFLIGGGLAAALLIAGGAAASILRKKSSSAEAKAKELLANWEKVLADGRPEYIGLEAGAKRLADRIDFKEGGKTAEKADETLKQAMLIGAYRREAEARIKAAQQLIQTGGSFSAKNFEEAIAILSDKKIPLDFNSMLEQISREEKGGTSGELSPMWSGLQYVKTQNLSFSDLIDGMGDSFKAGLESIAALERVIDQADDKVAALGATIKVFEDRDEQFAGYAERVPTFRIDAVRQSILPELALVLKKAEAELKEDPWASYEAVQQLEPKLHKASTLLDGLSRVAVQVLPGVLVGRDSLIQSGVEANWITDKISTSSNYADRCLSTILTSKQSEELDLASAFVVLEELVTYAQQLNTERVALAQELVEIDAVIAAKRVEIGTQLGFSADESLHKILHENGTASTGRLLESLNPSEYVAEARNFNSQVARALGDGKLKEALDFGERGSKMLAEARDIVADTESAFKSYEQRHAALLTSGNELKSSFDRYDELLGELKFKYMESALSFTPTSGGLKEDDGTIVNNMDQARLNFNALYGELAHSSVVYKDGAILHADLALYRAEAYVELARYRLTEITNVSERISAAVTRIDRDLDLLPAQYDRMRAKIQEPHVRQSTIDTYEAGAQALKFAGSSYGASKCDPFEVVEGLSKAQDSLNSVQDEIIKDRQRLSDAHEKVSALSRVIERARQLAQQCERDNIVDSKAIREARELLRVGARLDIESGKLTAALKVRHNDWTIISAAADRLVVDVDKVKATLGAQMDLGNRAVERLNISARAIESASDYVGSRYHTRINGEPGADIQREAQLLLSRGEYEQAIEASTRAVAATESAKRALDRKEEELYQEAKRAEARADAERRRAAIELARAAASMTRVASSSTRSSSIGGSFTSSSPSRSTSSARSSGGGHSKSGFGSGGSWKK